MWQSNHNLASLIGSRICHDLISPIGAIQNGVELLSLDSAASVSGPEMSLISDSVNHASARIRFLRVAFGVAGSDQQMSASEIASILDAISAGARVTFDWTLTEAAPRSEVQLVFLALQCFESAMPHGGTVTVTRQADDAGWEISGPADPARPDPRLWRTLDDPAAQAAILPAQVQFALLPALLTDQGRRILVQTQPCSVTLRF
ncbi:histidine phosphotransferase family protein [Pseudooceanicola nanhaiensis]|uniref:histidine phosphotransferase family protein n=1 Tax=Pseudooceanicola nanhaiensis TaxID=375761 RepID=UPI001CD41C34|nr:histidine phosphotransferase family protein [Pseudooceanicola nanhaiensis]MCA0921624.1 histidine phosphotransferase [Pseudooceanicola nanhaiensis]